MRAFVHTKLYRMLRVSNVGIAGAITISMGLPPVQQLNPPQNKRYRIDRSIFGL